MKKMYSLLVLFALPFMAKAETDKYRLVLTSNPSTTITVAWNQISGSNAVVKYGKQDLGQNATAYPLSKTIDRSTSFRGMNNQFARLTGLEANTNYYYVIQDSEGVSERFWFKTAPSDRSKLSFIAGGDSRNNREPRKNANKLVSKLKPNAVFFGGDMTNQDSSREWQDWLDDWQLTTADDGRMTPIIPARGNHEGSDTIYNLFDTSNEDSYFAITFGDNFFRVYTLNSEISLFGDQKEWLENDLQNNESTLYKSVQYHKPMRPHSFWKTEGNDVYNAWANVFYQNKVQLVVDCDSHTVKATHPIKPSNEPGSDEGFKIDQENGTVYVGEGCWGAPLRNNDDDKTWTRSSGKFNQFKWIIVNEDKIELRTVKVNNADQVGEVSNEDRFTAPSNLDVWTMNDGEKVIEIKSKKFPKLNFASDMSSEFSNRFNVDIKVEVTDEADGIENFKYTAVKFNSQQVINLGQVNSNTFNMNATLPSDGAYKVMVTANTVSGVSKTIEKTIFVGNFTTSIEVPIISGKNDVEQGVSNNGAMYFDSSDLELGKDNYKNQGFQKVGLRFEDIEIPNGAVINSAAIQFTSKGTYLSRAQSTIYIQNSADANNFEDQNFNLTNREYLSNRVVWNIPRWWSINQKDQNTTTPNLSYLVQKIVDKSNWKEGSDLVFKLQPTGKSLCALMNRRVAHSFDKSSDRAPKLFLSYTYKAKQLRTSKQVATKPNCYPNPTDGKVYIKYPKTSNLEFNGVFDMVGQKYSAPYYTENNKIVLDMKKLNAKVYIVHFSDKKTGKVYTEQIIKK